ncbi:hypothetical protein [Tunturiibacter lichenicola]|uniref:hypothetical protein n=1 Tax=Tunturiibacter lichenicola TaxID=2051959 RepID=UPI003D9AD8C4
MQNLPRAHQSNTHQQHDRQRYSAAVQSGPTCLHAYHDQNTFNALEPVIQQLKVAVTPQTPTIAFSLVC